MSEAAAQYLECPCCGCEGAEADADGCFTDGQRLICGCTGQVSIDEDGDAWVSNGDGCEVHAQLRGGAD